jgi:hypothetical protein
MFLDLLHEKLAWPAPEETRNPSGEGGRIFADLVHAKVERAARHLASDVSVSVLLKDSQTSATEAPLALVAEFSRTASNEALRELHRLAWNFSHSPSLITIEPHILRVWTCCELPNDSRKLDDYIIHELPIADLTAVHQSGIAQRATEVLHWVNLVSGQFFREHSERFQRDQRADQMLLGNLRYLRQRLHQGGLDNDDVCHDLLARVVFVQFLFDRKDAKGHPALDQNKLAILHQQGILTTRHADFPSILADYEDTYRLFDWLNNIFNGDLFPGKGNSNEEREREWQEEKNIVKPIHLQLLREFIKGDLDMPTGQFCLWPYYAFDAIPLEFISSIYETFVTERASGDGIFYTPPHLVDFILDRVLPWNSENWNLKVLDPSCGSGIFLVKAFQRLIHRWKLAHPGKTIRAEILRGLLEKNLFGVDKDTHAVRVASFSLYLAMCDEIDPKFYWSQVKFPPMRGKRLINSDFFDESQPGFRTEEDAASYDLVIGNAPWGEKLLTPTAKKWATDKKHPWPLANKGIGTLFLPKSAALAKPEGSVAMIQSASSLLFNRSNTASNFRNRFFSAFHTEEIINLSALRFKVFNRKTHASKTSVAPSCIVVFKPILPSNCRIGYISPKQIDESSDEFEIVVDPNDYAWIYADDAANDPSSWSVLMWGNNRDHALIRRLSKMDSLDKFEQLGKICSREGVIFGDRKKLYEELRGRRILTGKESLTTKGLYFKSDNLETIDEPYIDSKASTDFQSFSLPQLIIKQAWQIKVGRFQAMLTMPSTNGGVICTQSYVSIHAETKDRNILEVACLCYNSILAVYFLLLTSGRFASYRPEPLVKELLSVPIPELKAVYSEVANKAEGIDQYIHEAFGFKDAEWVLIEDLCNFTLPDFKGDVTSPGRQRTQRHDNTLDEPDLSKFCEYFIRVLKAGFGQNKNISATIFQEVGTDLLPYRLVAFELNRSSNKPYNVMPLNTFELLAELETLNQTWLRSQKTSGGSIYHQRIARIYEYRDGVPTIFILKPDARRYWTRSMGLHDGDEVAADFMRWQQAQNRG